MLVPNLIVINYPKPTSGANALTIQASHAGGGAVTFHMHVSCRA
jgi:hypothetical protein